MNKGIFTFFSLILAIVGFQIGHQKEEKVQIGIHSVKQEGISGNILTKNEDDNRRKNDFSKKRDPQSLEERNQEMDEGHYFNSHLGDPVNLKIYVRTKNIFKNFDKKEAMARWMVLGNFFSSSEEYSKIFESTVRKMNEAPFDTLNEIKSKIKKMKRSDSFLRGMVVNLVHHLDIEDDEKVSFFGSELARKLTLDEKGGFSEDSFSVVPSLIYLKNYGKDNKVTIDFLRKALEANKKKPDVQEALKVRYLAYFPHLAHRI
jgi:hypothetical protein